MAVPDSLVLKVGFASASKLSALPVFPIPVAMLASDASAAGQSTTNADHFTTISVKQAFFGIRESVRVLEEMKAFALNLSRFGALIDGNTGGRPSASAPTSTLFTLAN